MLDHVIVTVNDFGALIGSRLVHGRELAKSPPDRQINTQSAPDAAGLIIVHSRICIVGTRHPDERRARRTVRWAVVRNKGCRPGSVGLG
jgi:hypothetical protein